MLDRSSGAILKTNGQISAVRPAKSASSDNALPTPTGGSFSSDAPTGADNDSETQAAQEMGSMVWGFLSTAGSLVQEIDTEVCLLPPISVCKDSVTTMLNDIVTAGRIEVAAATDEEARARYCAGNQVHPCRYT